MLTLYDCAFSPFARKVRLVLEHKGLAFNAVDGLRKSSHEALAAVNPRREVPVLVDEGMVVVNSAHIVAYLEDAYPSPAVLPADARGRARARHWERIADTMLDPIVVGASVWSWAKRADEPPEGLRQAARRDLDSLYAALERTLAADIPFLCGSLSLADIALFPNLHAARTMRLGMDARAFPLAAAWLARLAARPLFQADIARLRAWLKTLDEDFELERIFWRGDRIEWLLASGLHRWFFREIEEGRAQFPGTSAHEP